jgi:NAD(P)-dependent dehydrogenase (short-subunit alcohol dehydrogenase family)
MADAKRVVITGATRGLGRAMVEGFIEQGLTVAGCGSSAGRVAAMSAEFGAPHSFAVVDVASDQQVADWARRVLEKDGAPDLLLNNAAVINENAPLWKVSAADFDRVIDVNIKGVANVIRHFLPAMLAQKQGVIVNFSSGWGRSTSPEVAPYCATKYAIEGLSQALARELPDGLCAVALNPGVIDTDMLRSCFGSASAGYPTPDEWGRAAVPYLLKLGPRDNGGSLTVPL